MAAPHNWGLFMSLNTSFNCSEKKISFLLILPALHLHYPPKQTLDFQVVFNKWEHQKIFSGVPKAARMFAEAKFSPFPTSKDHEVLCGEKC